MKTIEEIEKIRSEKRKELELRVKIATFIVHLLHM